ncbi:proline-rich protein 36 isoform X2 [Mangifera indica]|nr:proline-rich protein 36 isoform X2 [Mangifera indica]XP_044506027.1 proline-rich protein 36 isoform X2 [Mangifera indica]
MRLGIPEVKDNQDSQLADQHDDQRSLNPQIDSEKLKLLEIEKREVIGEILKLNPSYKTPPDYKPLLKEAIVPIPVKDYRGYNFLGLIFGPASDTQKRLEKETETIIQVCGTKPDTGEKVEISPSDENVQSTFEELYINISADTYEKVDAAADLIELLVNSVSENLAAISTSTLVSGENSNTLSQGQDEANPFLIHGAAVNQGVAPVVGPMQTPVQVQFQYQNPWFTSGPPQTPIHPLNSSAPVPTNPVNTVSPFGPRPAGFTSTFPNSQIVPQNSLPPMQVPHPYMPQIHSLGHTGSSGNFAMPSPQTSSAQLQGGPLIPSLPQAVSSIPPRPLPDRPLTPPGNPSGWPGASLGSSNMGQLAPVMVPPQGPRPGVSQPGVASNALPNMSVGSMVSPFPSGPSSTALNRHVGPVFPSGPPPRVGPSPAFPASAPMQSSPFVPMAASSGPSIIPPNFSPVNPPTGTPSRPQLPGSGDFTFQPHRQQNLAPLTVPRPSSQPAVMNTPPHRPMGLLPSPQAPSFRLTGPIATAQTVMQGFPRPQVGDQVGQPQAPMFANPNAAFANVSHVAPTTLVSQMIPRNFGVGPQVPNLAGPFLPRPGNSLQLQHNYPAPANRHENHRGLIQQFGNSRPFTSDKLAPSRQGPQIYDPFSPTSSSIPPQQQGANPTMTRKQENDPEYEDLMASVGVK